LASSKVIYHLTTQNAITLNQLRQGETVEYSPVSLSIEGFIHCTKERDLVLDVANRFYKNKPLEDPHIVLEISIELLTSKLIFEGAAPVAGSNADPNIVKNDREQILFPHIYGPINAGSIISVYPVQRDTKDGSFLKIDWNNNLLARS